MERPENCNCEQTQYLQAELDRALRLLQTGIADKFVDLEKSPEFAGHVSRFVGAHKSVRGWNARHEGGSVAVRYYQDRDNRDQHRTTEVVGRAWVLDGHSAVVTIENEDGTDVVALDCIEVAD